MDDLPLWALRIVNFYDFPHRLKPKKLHLVVSYASHMATPPSMLYYPEWLVQETERTLLCELASLGFLAQSDVPSSAWRVSMQPYCPQLVHEVTWCHLDAERWTMARSFRLPFNRDFSAFQYVARAKIELLGGAFMKILYERKATVVYGLEVHASYLAYSAAEPTTIGIMIDFFVP